MRAGTIFVAGLTLLAACGDPTTTDRPAGLRPSTPALSRGSTASENQQLATLRATLGPLHRFDAAKQAGWNNQFPPGCFESDSGAMGFHFMKAENVGTLDPSRPQLLLFEPEKNGQMRLVGVEFIYPGVPTDPAPVLFEQPFTYNYTFSVWALHVWALEANPNGIFASWNPKVSCAYATTLATKSHH